MQSTWMPGGTETMSAVWGVLLVLAVIWIVGMAMSITGIPFGPGGMAGLR
jgi:hypothetical protein